MSDFIVKDGTLTNVNEHKQNLRDQDGEVSKHITEDMAKEETAHAKEQQRRTQLVKDRAKAIQDRKTSEKVKQDTTKGEVAGWMNEDEKEIKAGEEKKVARDALVEQRKRAKQTVR